MASAQKLKRWKESERKKKKRASTQKKIRFPEWVDKYKGPEANREGAIFVRKLVANYGKVAVAHAAETSVTYLLSWMNGNNNCDIDRMQKIVDRLYYFK